MAKAKNECGLCEGTGEGVGLRTDRVVPCPACDGFGDVEVFGERVACLDCGGTGAAPAGEPAGPAGECVRCGGQGEVPSRPMPRRVCDLCGLEGPWVAWFPEEEAYLCDLQHADACVRRHREEQERWELAAPPAAGDDEVPF
jgi:hypothetical protein